MAFSPLRVWQQPNQQWWDDGSLYIITLLVLYRGEVSVPLALALPRRTPGSPALHSQRPGAEKALRGVSAWLKTSWQVSLVLTCGH